MAPAVLKGHRAATNTGDPMRYILLLAPCVAALAAPFYNRIEPQLFGFPFFYWFNLLLVPVSVVFIYAASRLGDDR